VTTQTYRRSRHSVSLLHAHLVFVTNYRRCAFTDAMLTFTEHTIGGVCAELDVELVEFNGEPTRCICCSPEVRGLHPKPRSHR
jgi:putative transposase